MSLRTYEDILPLVERPSRYVGTEINSVKKNLEKVKLLFALAFPDLYEIGMSHFGIQILYHILNQNEKIAAERVFAPALDMQALLKGSGIPLVSLESKKPLVQFDIIGFSLLYELNYTNVLSMLDLAGIPLLSSLRDSSYPIIIGGGPCTSNPEPIADFFDAIVIGEGEKTIMELADAWMDWKTQGAGDKNNLLNVWSGIEGVYIPGHYRAEYDEKGFQTLHPKRSKANRFNKKITRAIVDDLNRSDFPDRPVVPYGKPIHDRLRIELSRGCARGCRFCQAGMIYRPVRERTPEGIIALCEAAMDSTGYEDISLLSLSTGDYGCIIPLMEQMMDRCESRRTAVSLPSIRAGTLSPKLMALIKKVRKTGFTIAPEAGSQRLRDIINKNITEKDIFDTVKDAFRQGWQTIKLYFMIGLPFETDEDLHDVVRLVRELQKIPGKDKRKKKMNISVATFIPKPHTPFQWAAQIPLSEAKEKISWLRNGLNRPGVQFKWQNPEVSVLEGIFARGDRRLAKLLTAAHRGGCNFDGWSDRFRYDLWEKAFIDAGVDVSFYTTRKRDVSEPLPWDHIDSRVTKPFLLKEWHNAAAGKTTPDCRSGDCNTCGVCDFEKTFPIHFDHCNGGTAKLSDTEKRSQPSYKRLMLTYSKLNQARYFGHLEMVNIFLRALRRANIPTKFSEGYHPMPKVSFDDPLPIGLESEKESLYLNVPDFMEPKKIVEDLNKHLPEGLSITGFRKDSFTRTQKISYPDTYDITLKEGWFNQDGLETFKGEKEAVIRRKDKKGREKTIDLKAVVLDMELMDLKTLRMTLRSEHGKTVRPQAVIKTVFNLPEEAIKTARIVKKAGHDSEEESGCRNALI